MSQVIIQREVLINAPLTHVWQLVATESGLRQWWGNTISLEAKEGGRCEEWRLEKNKSSHWQGVVTIYTPPHHLMLTLKAQEPEEGRPEFTTISIGLESKGEQTHVYVTQRGFEPDAAIGITEQEKPLTHVPHAQRSPMAQLQRVTPGTVPDSVPDAAPLQTLAVGKIDPAHFLVSHDYANVLELVWQTRFTSLLAALLPEFSGQATKQLP